MRSPTSSTSSLRVVVLVADIRPRGCRHECQTTWRWEHGASVPGGPFPGTMADPGDVRRCEHGRVWVATGRVAKSYFFTEHDVWERLTTWGSPLRYRRAVRALATPEEAGRG